jgi:FixJ family two-component response regulator
LPEEKRLLIRNATQRINDIANGLLQQGKTQSEKVAIRTSGQRDEVTMLVALLDSIISEKRSQYRNRMGVEIQGDLAMGYGIFVAIKPAEFFRVISNLINNSVEAIEGSGRILVGIRSYKNEVSVIVSDNGKGIPPEILEQLGQRGVTHGKNGTQSGSGLGVYHARETVENAGGKFAIQSQLGAGTMVTLTLPRAAAPRWFVEKILVPAGTSLVSVDDDQTIHQIWAGRLSSAGEAANVQHLSFSSIEHFEDWATDQPSKAAIFLVDYEFLGQKGTGIDLIERTGIADRAILVTSRYEEPHVRARADALGLRILPKAQASLVPLIVEKPREKFSAVLIDDDSLINQPIMTNSSLADAPSVRFEAKIRYDLCLIDDDQVLVHAVWASVASSKGLKIKLFASPQAFHAEADKIDRQTPIYVDVSLGNGVSGIDVAEEIHKLGFEDINLATGYQADSMIVPSFIRRVVGKDFPDVG